MLSVVFRTVDRAWFALPAELPARAAGQRQVVQHRGRDGAVPERGLHHHQQQDHRPRHPDLQHAQRVLLRTSRFHVWHVEKGGGFALCLDQVQIHIQTLLFFLLFSFFLFFQTLY